MRGPAGGGVARGGCVVAALTAFAAASAAHADPAGVVNALRLEGCADVAAAGSPVRRTGALDAAARELARGAKLSDALARVGYPSDYTRSIYARGSSDDAAIRSALVARHCKGINDPKFAELGVYQSGGETWIVMSVRSETPFAALQDPAGVARRVLELVNAARTEARRCGRDSFEPAPPLTMATTLTAAASLHAIDMAARGELTHDGSDGSDSGERMTRAGYTWQIAGENVAAGQPDAEAVVASWLRSPGHCATLMDARYTETGIAFALAPGKNPAVYWAQDFAAPP